MTVGDDNQIDTPVASLHNFPPRGFRMLPLIGPSIVRAASALAMFFAFVSEHECAADEPPVPLHQHIDEIVSRHQLGKTRGASDLGFLRRVTLDLAGRIPTVSEARAFAADASAAKRTALIDRLLSSDEFSRHWATTLDVMLMERRTGTHVKTDEFRAWLSEAVKADKPLNQLCAELVAADGTPEKQRPAAAFFLERAAEPNLMTRDIGRMFFGMDLQCAQCHDHPLVADYHQSDYYGLFAFVSRTTVFRPNAKKPALLAETAGGFSEFKSVFTERESVTLPRVPNAFEVADPFFGPGQEYVVSPAKNVRHVPRYSRRSKLAALIGSGDNDLFRRNIANRIWAVMFGRGIVHPVDLHHSENPPSNPELMDLISTEFAAMNFSLRNFVREIALSQPYQSSLRSFEPLVAAEQLDRQRELLTNGTVKTRAASPALSAQIDKAIENVDAVFVRLTPLRAAWEKTQKAARDQATKYRAAIQKLEPKQAQLTTKTSLTKLLESSEASTRSAGDLLKDIELTTLADQMTTRLAKLKSESNKLSTEIAKLQATVTAEKSKFDASAQTALVDYGKLKPLVVELLAARSAVVTARWKLYANDARAEFLTQRTSEVTRLLELIEHPTTIKAAHHNIAALTKELPTMAATVTQLTEKVNAAKVALASSSAAMNKEESRRASLAGSEVLLRQSLALIEQAKGHLEKASANKQSAVVLADMVTASKRLDVQAKGTAATTKALQERVTNSLESVSRQERIVEEAEAELIAKRRALDEAQKRLTADKQLVNSLTKESRDHLDALAKSAIARLESPVLQALTPEQFCWSALHATGQFNRQVVAARAKLDKKTPLKAEELKDPVKVRQREQEAHAEAIKNMNAIVGRFVRLFAAQAGQPQGEFFATVDQALYTSNGGEIRSWLNPSGGNLADRLVKTETAQAFADELYLAVFTRKPEPEEVADIAQYLAASKDKRKATQEIGWALLSSAEFRFQH